MFGHIPFLRYLLLLLSGIFASEVIRAGNNSVLLFILIGCITLLAICLYLNIGKSLKILPLFVVFLLGWIAGSRQLAEYEQRIQSVLTPKYVAYYATIADLPEKRLKSTRQLVTVNALVGADTIHKVDSPAILYFSNGLKHMPDVGERILIKGTLVRPPAAESPFGFDYRKYLEKKGIPWVGYVQRDEQLLRFPDPELPGSLSIAAITRNSERIFRYYLPDPEVFGLMKAMILGRREDISPELNQAFTDSGTVHILSVSGLHIAIFFSMLNFLFGPLRRFPGGKLLYLFSIGAILVGYVVITGLPASVQRATLMCIIWMIGQNFSRKHQPLNTLAIAAFYILLFDPAALYDVGFQLSFLAMLGIFMWMKPFQTLLQTENSVVRHIRDLVAMSLAAQLMTLPLILYYFNQFPTYFLFANLLVVDLAGLLIPAAIGLLFLGGIGLETLASLLGMVVSLIARIINWGVKVPEKLPFHVIDQLYFDLLQSLIFLLVLTGIYFAWIERSKAAFFFTFTAALCFFLYSSVAVLKDYTSSFSQIAFDGERAIVKIRSSAYILEKMPAESKNTFSGNEMRKLMARYPVDTIHFAIGTKTP